MGDGRVIPKMPRPLWFSETPDAPLDGRTGALLWETVAGVLNDRRCDDAREDPSAVDARPLPAAARRSGRRRAGVVRMGGRQRRSRASLGSLLSFYPAAGATESGVAFSDTPRAADRAVVRPSVAFWQWLRSPGAPPWQMRGELKLTATDVIALVGPHIAAAAAALRRPRPPRRRHGGGGADAVRRRRCPNTRQSRRAAGECARGQTADQAALDVAVGGQRVHADAAPRRSRACARAPARGHKAILSRLGARRASRRAIAGRLPRAVAETGNTQDFVADASAAHGDLDAVHGLHVDADEPTAVRTTVGEHATLAPGDMLVLPSGLYHDVQCGAEGVGLSLTVRFELVDDNDPGDDAAASQPVAATDGRRARKTPAHAERCSNR